MSITQRFKQNRALGKRCNLTNMRAPRSHFGNSMIEVLVSLVIMSVGSLGVAGLQATSKKTNLGAQQRLVATFLANDIIERMRNNPSALSTYAASNVGGSTLATATRPACSAGARCGTVDLARHDLWAWEQAIDGATAKIGTANVGGLIRPTGCITNVNGQVQVVVAWHGATDSVDAGAGANGVNACGTANTNRRQVVINTFIE